MKNRIILDLCGGTGAWSTPYRDAGYDVRLITLPDHDVRLYKPPESVHGILAAPPCTEFSLAKGNQPRNFTAGMEIVEACLKIIWAARIEGHLKWWCMENPRGFLRQFIGVPAVSVQYWQFGDSLCKPTDLWGYFTRPQPLCHTKPKGLPKLKDAMNRDHQRGNRIAVTPPRFAQAFFKANP